MSGGRPSRVLSKFVLAHLSDLHVSTFGDTFHDGLRLVRRSGKPFSVPANWIEAHSEHGWILVHPPGKPQKLQLLDPQRYAHGVPRQSKTRPEPEALARGIAKLRLLERRSSASLAAHPPSASELEALYAETPRNSNLRLLRAVASLHREHIDAVLVTGDLTDHGTGYDLLLSVFEPWIRKGMFFAVPGNHDLYKFPILGSTRPKLTVDEKRAKWTEFQQQVGIQVGPEGAWFRYLDGPDVALVGLNSCVGPQKRFFRHDGALGPAQIAWLRALRKNPDWRRARVRLVAFHHHLDRLAMGIGRRHAPELGLKLTDAKEVAVALNEIGATAILHGHRHVSERRQPARSNFEIFASSSTTLGCRSGDEPSYWRIEIGDESFDAFRRYTDEPAVPMSIPPRAYMGEDDE